MTVDEQIYQVKQAYDFCFADEEKSNGFQVQLDFTKSDWSNNSYAWVEKSFLGDIKKHPNYLDYLEYHFEWTAHKKEFIESVGKYAYDHQLRHEAELLSTYNMIPASAKLNEPYFKIQKWVKRKERGMTIMVTRTNVDNVLDKWAGKENKFNTMPLQEVSDYFHKELRAVSRNGKPHLGIAEIDQFIERAFCQNESISPLTLNYQREKTKVVDVFYRYYEQCVTDYVYESTYSCQAKYKGLIDDNFSNMGTYNFRRK